MSLNVSPTMIARRSHMRAVVAGADRPVVLELTEHEPVDDYGGRSAARSCALRRRPAGRSTTRGRASPASATSSSSGRAFVKADRGWIHGLVQDLSCQAIVRGLRSLAESTGADVIAEGVERLCDMENGRRDRRAVRGRVPAEKVEPSTATEWQ